jgi:hypothetical protein
MSGRIMRWALALVIAFAFVGFGGDKTNSDSKPTIPFVVKANIQFQNLSLKRVTSKYVIFGSAFSTRMYIDVASGDVVPDSKLDYESLANEIPLWAWASDKFGECWTSNNFNTLESVIGKWLAIGYKNGYQITVIDPTKGIYAKSRCIDDNNCMVTIFRDNPYQDLYSFGLNSGGTFNGLAFGGHYLFLKGSGSQAIIIDLDTGVLKLVFNCKMYSSNFKVSGNLIQLCNVVLDQKTLEIKYSNTEDNTQMNLSDDACYTWRLEKRNGIMQQVVYQYDLKTKKTDDFVFNLNGDSKTRKSTGTLFGVTRGLAYYYEGINGYFEVFDLVAGKAILSVPANQTHPIFFGGDNDKQIILSDGGTVYCFDISKRKLAWKKAIATRNETIEENGLRLCMLAEGEDKTKIVDMNNQARKILLKTSDIDRDSRRFFFYQCAICTHIDGTTCSVKRYNWDGTTVGLPPMLQEDKERVPITFAMTGDRVFLIKYDYRQSDEKIYFGRFYELEDNQWKKFIELDNPYNYILNDKFLVIALERKILIYDLAKKEKTYIDDTRNYSYVSIAGNKVLYYCEDLKDYEVFDIMAKKIICRVDSCRYIGTDDSTFYFLSNKKVITITDGVIKEIENTRIDSTINESRYKVIGGMLAYDGKLLSLDGKIKQTLVQGGSTTFYKNENRLFVDDRMYSLTNADLVPCSTYTMTNDNSRTKLTNTGTHPIKGRFCLVDTNNDFSAVRLDGFKTFSVDPGKSVELISTSSGKEQLLAVNADAVIDMAKFDFPGKSKNADTYVGTNIDYDGTAWTLTLWNKKEQ